MNLADQTFVIVGAGLAGGKAAQALREEGFTGRVVLIGEEPHRPYERPPLSKGYLLGKDDATSIYVHDEDWYDKNSVQLRLDRRVTALDRTAHQVELDDGEHIRYDKLLLATGARPRRLGVPGADLGAVHYLRRVEESQSLQIAFAEVTSVVVVGAGWIGLETAAAARHHGCEVTVVAPESVPLAGVLGPEIGEVFADLHRQQGVDLRLGRTVTGILGEDGRVTGVFTDDGTHIAADRVVIGIGVDPDTALAERAQLPVDNGILVDQALRTRDPDVYAAGDVANAYHPRYQRPLRVEHWANALNQGAAAARAMLGQDVSYDRIPYFFTDQYDAGMEFSGWFPPGGYDTVVTRGDVAGRAFHAFWLADQRVVAGIHLNQWEDGIAPVQQLIRSGHPVDPRRLADPGTPFGELDQVS